MIGLFHRLLIGVLTGHRNAVKADIGSTLAVSIVFHRATPEPGKLVEPLVEQHANAQPPQDDPLSGELHLVIDFNRSVAAHGVAGGMGHSKAVLPAALYGRLDPNRAGADSLGMDRNVAELQIG